MNIIKLVIILFIGDYMDNEKAKHSLNMENRQALEMTGISNVTSFNDEEIVAVSDWGDLVVKGDNLNVEELDLQTGDLRISGRVTAIIYSERVMQKGWLKRVFS